MKIWKKAALGTLATLTVLAVGVALFQKDLVKPLADQLKQNCQEQMSKGSCAIMHNSVYLPPEIKQIFIAGYGSLDASIYRNLTTSGVLMCEQIRSACGADETTEVCRLGKALYLHSPN